MFQYDTNIKKHKGLIYIALVLVAGNILCLTAAVSFSDESAIYFLDVGQGDAQLISHEGIWILIDTGKDAKASTELEKIRGSKKYIDIVALTHSDLDHAGGIYQILDRFEVGTLLLTKAKKETWNDVVAYAQQKNVLVYEIDMHDTIAFKDMLITVLWPDPTYPAKDDNEGSLVLKFDNLDYTTLFTADIPQNIEEILIKLHHLDTDILKVGHHGSKYSSSEAFLHAVSPSLSIIEVGKNSYGHPTQEVLQRLGAIGSHILRTDQNGTVRVYYDEGVLQIESL